MLKEIPYSAEIECDICRARDVGSPGDFFRWGWVFMRAEKDGPKSFENIALCHGCVYVMRFRDSANWALYSNKPLVLEWLKKDLPEALKS